MNWADLAVAALTLASVVIGHLETRRKIREVHVLVNSRLATVVDRVAQLTGALHQAGVDVPPSPGHSGGSGSPPGKSPG